MQHAGERRVDAQHGEIGRLVAAEHRRVERAALVAEAHLDHARLADDVGVGDDRAGAVDQEARAGRLAGTLARGDRDDAGARAGVDLPDLRAAELPADRAQRRRVVRAADAEHEEQADDHRRAGQRADEDREPGPRAPRRLLFGGRLGGREAGERPQRGLDGRRLLGGWSS